MICDSCDSDPDTCNREPDDCEYDAQLSDAEDRFEAMRDARE